MSPSVLIALLVLIAGSQVMANRAVSKSDLDKAYAEEIKEFHFHIYFFQDNPQSNRSAEALFKKIQDLVAAGFFHPVPLRINYRPVGPHTIGSYEVWCPKEYFSRTYSWMLLNRGPHQVLIHPLTRLEVKDHSERAAWMGSDPVPLDLSALSPLLDRVPLQYPELGLGYSAPPQ